jgi:hypothetical protein
VFGLILLSDCTGVIKAIQSKCKAAKDRWKYVEKKIDRNNCR